MSGRIRTIKPEFLEDEKTGNLSDRDFRLFLALILLADDYGNSRAEPGLLSAQIWWGHTGELAHPERTSAGLEELEQVGLITIYEVRSQRYLHINGWEKHQKVDHPGKPRVPQPGDPDSWVRTESFVYFIQSGEDGPIKIGRAVDVPARIRSLQVASPRKLRLLGTIPGGEKEKEVHARFVGSRMQGEWFKPTKPLLEFIASTTSREDPRPQLARPLAPDQRPTTPTNDPDPDPDPDQRTQDPETETGGKPPCVGSKPQEIEPVQTSLELAPPPEPKRSREQTQRVQTTEVLQHWQSQPYHRGKVKLTSERRARVVKRLSEGFTVEDLKLAIEGAALDRWLMGTAPTSTKAYKDVDTILRDAGQVERLRELGTEARRRRQRDTVRANESELDRLMRTMPPWASDPRTSTAPTPEAVADYKRQAREAFDAFGFRMEAAS